MAEIKTHSLNFSTAYEAICFYILCVRNEQIGHKVRFLWSPKAVEIQDYTELDIQVYSLLVDGFCWGMSIQKNKETLFDPKTN